MRNSLASEPKVLSHRYVTRCSAIIPTFYSKQDSLEFKYHLKDYHHQFSAITVVQVGLDSGFILNE
jgi:hypothetical protein